MSQRVIEIPDKCEKCFLYIKENNIIGCCPLYHEEWIIDIDPIKPAFCKAQRVIVEEI